MTDAGKTLNLTELKAWEGREEVARDTLELSTLNRAAAFLNLGAQMEQGTPLPETWHWFFFHPAIGPRQIGTDGHPHTGGFLPPFDLPRRMWGGSRLTFDRPLRAGEPAERRSRVRSVDLKTGRSGTLGLVTVEHVITQNGERCRSELQDIVYRAAASGPQPVPDGPAAPGTPETSRVIDPNPVMLFKFSALTWNAHRIHYDRAYASDVEGYPGLVVHGPLTATLLAMLSREARGNTAMRNFTFRGTSPLFADTPFELNLCRNGATDTLWAGRAGAGVAMTATAEY